MCLIWGVPARKKTSDTREDPMVWGKESLSFPIDLHVHSLDGKTTSICLSFYVLQTCTWCFFGFVITWIIRRQNRSNTLNKHMLRYQDICENAQSPGHFLEHPERIYSHETCAAKQHIMKGKFGKTTNRAFQKGSAQMAQSSNCWSWTSNGFSNYINIILVVLWIPVKV